MFLKITNDAKQKLQQYLDEDTTVLLDLDDGVGKYSKVGLCTLNMDFRILFLNKDMDKKEYNLKIDSDIGDIYVKDYSKIYMNEVMTLDLNKQSLRFILNSPSGVLGENVQIVDFRKKINA